MSTMDLSGSVCRVCLIEKDILIDLSINFNSESIVDKINHCANIQVEIGDLYPQTICVECLNNLKISYEFKKLCEQSEKTLSEIYNKLDEDGNILVEGKIHLEEPLTKVISEFKSLRKENKNIPGLNIEKIVIKRLNNDSKSEDTIVNNDVLLNPLVKIKEEVLHLDEDNLEDNDDAVSEENEELKDPLLDVKLSTKEITKGKFSVVKVKSKDGTERKSYVCQKCSKTFRSRAGICTHIMYFHEGLKRPRFQCGLCPKSFKAKDVRKDHHFIHHGVKAYICTICGERFPYWGLLRIHKTMNHPLKYKCSLCPKSFAQRNLRNNHEKLHNDENMKVCQQCGELYHSNLGCTFCAVIRSKSEMKDREANKNTCYICKIKFRTTLMYIKHLKNLHPKLKNHNEFHNDENVHVCQRCGDVYNTNLGGHDCAQIKVKSVPKNRKKPVPKNKKIHTAMVEKTCYVCKETFRTAVLLAQHMSRRHPDEKPYKCRVCPKAYKWKFSLQDHENHHTGTKQYLCNLCGRTFIQKATYVQHVKKHAEVSKWRCTVCPKVFRSNSDLQHHVNMHIGFREYECDICHQGFFSKRNLRCHLKNKHSITQSVVMQHCTICDKAFSQLYKLNRHMLIHPEATRYQCDYCHTEFAVKNALEGHIIRHKYDN